MDVARLDELEWMLSEAMRAGDSSGAAENLRWALSGDADQLLADARNWQRIVTQDQATVERVARALYESQPILSLVRREFHSKSAVVPVTWQEYTKHGIPTETLNKARAALAAIPNGAP